MRSFEMFWTLAKSGTVRGALFSPMRFPAVLGMGILLLWPAVWSWAQPTGEAQYEQFSQVSMSTRIDVVVPASPQAAAHADMVFQQFREIEAQANEWKAGSALAEVNRNAGGKPVIVPEDVWHLVKRGQEIGAMTDGAFDITWAALWGLWDFNKTESQVPDPVLLQTRRALIDFRKIELIPSSRSIRLPQPGMKIGLGGLAKGYALDRAAAALRARGVSSFSLSAGGQIYASGKKGERPWRVGVRDPRGDAEDYFSILEVSDASVSTSGDYERFFLKEGVRYHHIIDPRTGMPSRGIRSATVICADATLADGLSTAFMVLGTERAMAIANSTPGVEALLVDDQGRVFVTQKLAGRLIRRHRPRP